MWLFTVMRFIIFHGGTSLAPPSSAAHMVCSPCLRSEAVSGVVSEMPKVSRDKAFALYKQQIAQQFCLDYLNVRAFLSCDVQSTLYNHTNMSTCDCAHCAISHIYKSANANSVYCRYCCNR